MILRSHDTVFLSMDRRIPPEPPTPIVENRRDVLELKVKQGMHKDAFDSALQRADQRRTMGSSDREVSAGVKQAQVAQRFETRNSPVHETRAETSSPVKPKELRKFEPEQMKPAETGAEFVHAQLGLQDFTAASPEENNISGSTKTLSDESMAMLSKKISSHHYGLHESLELEFIDDPSGVVGVKLTKNLNDSWDVNLVLASNEKRPNEKEHELSQNLASQLQQSGIAVDSVSVDVDLHAPRAVGS